MNEKDERYVVVPYQTLSEETLQGIIKDFVLREGTDYGIQEYTLEEKMIHVTRQLERKEVSILYDTVEESCNLYPADRRSYS